MLCHSPGQPQNHTTTQPHTHVHTHTHTLTQVRIHAHKDAHDRTKLLYPELLPITVSHTPAPSHTPEKVRMGRTEIFPLPSDYYTGKMHNLRIESMTGIASIFLPLTLLNPFSLLAFRLSLPCLTCSHTSKKHLQFSSFFYKLIIIIPFRLSLIHRIN